VRLFDAGAPEDRDIVVHDKVWTVANAITAVRLLGLPLFVWLMVGPRAYVWAFVTLALVGATDWVDGYVARRFDQVTRLGRLMDPLIDRMLLATAALTLVWVGFLPAWLALLVVGRDIALLAGVALRYKGVPPVPVSRTGKFATACLLIGVPCFLLAHVDWPLAGAASVLAWVASLVGVAAYYYAGWQYVIAAWSSTRSAPPLP
jgi:cardiolipin synthase